MIVRLFLQLFGSPSTPVLENPEYQTRWYFKYFLGKRESICLTLDITVYLILVIIIIA